MVRLLRAGVQAGDLNHLPDRKLGFRQSARRARRAGNLRHLLCEDSAAARSAEK